MSDALLLRAARADDCRLLFDWANDADTRRASFSEGAIEWEEHVRWFQRTIADPSRRLYVVTRPVGERVGQARLDLLSPSEAVISLSIAPQWRGRGFAVATIRLVASAARDIAALRTVRAYIKPENARSLRAFARAGFSAPVAADHRGHAARCMSLTW